MAIIFSLHHPGSVLVLKKLAQIIANIVCPQNANIPPSFLDNSIVSPEFWHAHLNDACRQATLSLKGQKRRLAGNQLCYWTSADADHCMKVTYLVVYLPPALGAYILQQHRTKGKIAIPSADQTLLGERNLARTRIFLMIKLKLIRNARDAAAQGVLSPNTTPFVADSQNLYGHYKLHWTLRFPSTGRPSPTFLLCPSKICKRPPSLSRNHRICFPFQLYRNCKYSLVSGSEALIHLAHVQHLWQSQLFVFLEGLAR